MNKRVVFLFFFLCLAIKGWSQGTTINWGPELPIADDELGLAGRTRDVYFTLQKDNGGFFLQKVKATDMSVVFTKKLTWKEVAVSGSVVKPVFWKIVQLKTSFVVLLRHEDRKLDREIIYAQKMDLEGNVNDTIRELASCSKSKRNRESLFLCEVSGDSSSFLVAEYPSYETYKNEENKFYMFGETLSLIKMVAVTFPYQDKDVSLKEYVLTRDGYMCMLVKLDVQARERKKDEESYYYQLLSINPAIGNQVNYCEINLDKRYIRDIKLFADRRNHIKCVGIFADMKENGRRKNGINGTFFISIEKKTGTLTSQSTKDFDTGLVEDLSGKRRASKDKGIHASYDLVTVLDKEDRGSVVILENSFSEVVTDCSTSGPCRSNTNFHSEELVFVYTDSGGVIQNYFTLPKIQIATEYRKNFNSVFATRYNHKTYLVLNDNKENTGNSFGRPFHDGPTGGVFLLTVTDSGQVSRAPILAQLEKKHYLLLKPKLTGLVKPNELMLYGYSHEQSLLFLKNKTKLRYGYLTIR